MTGFRYREVLPDVYHIEDSLGVCMTLLCGSREALLADAGYGLEDVAAFTAALTDRPVRLILTHGHYDHILGAGWFPEAAVFAEDEELLQEHENAHIEIHYVILHPQPARGCLQSLCHQK